MIVVSRYRCLRPHVTMDASKRVLIEVQDAGMKGFVMIRLVGSIVKVATQVQFRPG